MVQFSWRLKHFGSGEKRIQFIRWRYFFGSGRLTETSFQKLLAFVSQLINFICCSSTTLKLVDWSWKTLLNFLSLFCCFPAFYSETQQLQLSSSRLLRAAAWRYFDDILQHQRSCFNQTEVVMKDVSAVVFPSWTQMSSAGLTDGVFYWLQVKLVNGMFTGI